MCTQTIHDQYVEAGFTSEFLKWYQDLGLAPTRMKPKDENDDDDFEKWLKGK
jgi:hypothetical protein